MAEDARFSDGDRMYYDVLRGTKASCKACKKNLHLRSHVHASMVKVLCPDENCEALLQDRPQMVQDHWTACHPGQGKRPRALRVLLPVPRCKV